MNLVFQCYYFVQLCWDASCLEIYERLEAKFDCDAFSSWHRNKTYTSVNFENVCGSETIEKSENFLIAFSLVMTTAFMFFEFLMESHDVYMTVNTFVDCRLVSTYNYTVNFRS